MRRRNYNEPGHAHELTFSCYQRIPLLSRERCYRWLADSINAARIALDFSVWAYVFMPDHVHVVIYPRRRDYKIEEIRSRIKQPIARRAMAYLRKHSPDWLENLRDNRKPREEYHFWQPGGGYDRNITEPKTLLKMIDYIHLNPVRKLLVEIASLWKWSSAGWFEGCGRNELRPDPIPTEWLM